MPDPTVTEEMRERARAIVDGWPRAIRVEMKIKHVEQIAQALATARLEGAEDMRRRAAAEVSAARFGEADTDFRSIIWAINSLPVETEGR